MIYHCECINAHQDRLHGKGRRVHNRCKSKQTGKFTNIRCTVCGSEKEVGEAKQDGR